MHSDIHVVVAGAGAMGCLFGGLLAERGLRVMLLARHHEHVAAIRRDGLVIRGEGGDRTVRLDATLEIGEIAPADVIFVQCKANATATVAARVLSLLGEDGLAVSFQNGLGNDDILSSIFGRERVIGGLTSLGATLEGPGIVRSYATLPTVIGELDGGLSERVNALAAVMSAYGIPTDASRNIRVDMWRKLLLNIALSATSGLTGLTIGEVVSLPALAGVAHRAMEEAAIVAAATGVVLPADERYGAFEAVVNSGAARNKTSMRRDIEAGRTTEVATIYDSVIALGRQHAVPTPTLDALAALIAGVEKRLST